MSIEEELGELLGKNRKVLEEVREFRRAVEDLDTERKKEVVKELRKFEDTLYAFEMDVDVSLLDDDMHFWIYQRILETIIEERKMKKQFSDLNQKVLRWQIKRLEKFFGNETGYSGNLREIAKETLEHRTERAEHHINLARKKNYLTYEAEYNAAKARHEIHEIASFEEKFGIGLAQKIKKRGFERGEEILENRPVVLVEEDAMKKAWKATEEVAGENPGETAGAFLSKRLGNGEILLEDFKNWDTYDSKGSVSLREEQVEKFWGETGRELVFWHCHPRASDMESARYSDRLSDGDLEMLTTGLSEGNRFGYMKGEKVGIREGISILTHPREYQEPEEDVYFLAPVVNNQEKAGYLNLHIVRDGKVVDEEYSWPKIYNKWIKAAMTGPDATGPYSTRKETLEIEEKLKSPG